MNRHKMGKRLGLVVAALVMAAAASIVAWAATRLDTVSDTYWDDSNITVAVWEEVEDADQYLVYLYCNESKVAEIKTKKVRYDFEKKMTKEGEYTFRVKALATSSRYVDSLWSDYSDGTYIDASYAELVRNGGKIDTKNSGPGAQATQDETGTTGVVGTNEPKWVQNETGWWYRRSDGTFPINGWFQDPANSKWYMFNNEGYMQTGWVQWDNATYYCGPDGAMVTGTQVIDGVTFSFDESGKKVGA